MNTKLLQLPFMLTIAGIISRILTYRYILFMYSGLNEYTQDMSIQTNLVLSLASIIMFFIIGLIIRQIYNRETCKKAVTILIFYDIALTLAGQLSQSLSYYGLFIVLYYLSLPTEIFAPLSIVLMNITNLNIWICNILFFFAPCLFILFTKRERTVL